MPWAPVEPGVERDGALGTSPHRQPGVSNIAQRPTFEVTPKVGVPPVLFGMSEADVKSVLGDPHSQAPGYLYYFEDMFHVAFKDGRVHFIELSWADTHFDVAYRGVLVFHTPAHELVEIISGEPEPVESHEYTDHDLDLGLWRPVLPSDSTPDAPDDEYRRGRYWLTIAIGDGGFFCDREGRSRS